MGNLSDSIEVMPSHHWKSLGTFRNKYNGTLKKNEAKNR